MTLSDRGIMCLWLLSLACSGWLVAHTRVTTDLAALLPASADRVQRLLVSQLRDGVASRLMLIGLEGGEPEALAEVSRKMTRRLLDSGLFNYANNGEAAYLSAEREVLMQHRYLLSPSVAPGRFTPAALRDALERDLQLLGSPMGSMIKSILPSDPTGELIQIMDHLSFGGGPTTLHGVWFSADGKRAQLIAETRAAGFDIDRQQEAVEVVRRAAAVSGLPDTGRVVMSGPGVFAVESRSVIERDSWKLSVIAGVLVILILLGTYRSLTIVLASMLPVLSGLLVGMAAVGALFGSVHGITLGFGATLIG
jgi:predicted exporter